MVQTGRIATTPCLKVLNSSFFYSFFTSVTTFNLNRNDNPGSKCK